MSFDLVKAVRVKGQPRHKFVLGLRSQKPAQPVDLGLLRRRDDQQP